MTMNEQDRAYLLEVMLDDLLRHRHEDKSAVHAIVAVESALVGSDSVPALPVS